MDNILSEVAISQYADLLRIGKLTINDALIQWKAFGIQRRDILQTFKAQFTAALDADGGITCPKSGNKINFTGNDKDVLWFWVMKAVSINYSLFEVMIFLQSHLARNSGKKKRRIITIETHNQSYQKHLVSYSFRLYESYGEIFLNWKKGENISSCDPVTAHRSHHGHISQISTCFPFPLIAEYRPIYKIQGELSDQYRNGVSRSLLKRAVPVCCLASRAGLDRTLPISENLSHHHHLQAQELSTAESSRIIRGSLIRSHSKKPAKPNSIQVSPMSNAEMGTQLSTRTRSTSSGGLPSASWTLDKPPLSASTISVEPPLEWKNRLSIRKLSGSPGFDSATSDEKIRTKKLEASQALRTKFNKGGGNRGMASLQLPSSTYEDSEGGPKRQRPATIVGETKSSSLRDKWRRAVTWSTSRKDSRVSFYHMVKMVQSNSYELSHRELTAIAYFELEARAGSADSMLMLAILTFYDIAGTNDGPQRSRKIFEHARMMGADEEEVDMWIKRIDEPEEESPKSGGGTPKLHLPTPCGVTQGAERLIMSNTLSVVSESSPRGLDTKTKMALLVPWLSRLSKHSPSQEIRDETDTIDEMGQTISSEALIAGENQV